MANQNNSTLVCHWRKQKHDRSKHKRIGCKWKASDKWLDRKECNSCSMPNNCTRITHQGTPSKRLRQCISHQPLLYHQEDQEGLANRIVMDSEPSHWCCEGVDFDDNSHVTNTEDVVCSREHCGSQSFTETTSITLIASVSITTVFITLFVLIGWIFWIKQKQPKVNRDNDAELELETLEKPSSSNPLPDVCEMRPTNQTGMIKRALKSGNVDCINENLLLNEQVKVLSYVPKLEMDRKHFTIGQILGSGN